MEKSFSKQSKIFYAFLICQFFFWAVIPSIFLKTIPLDTSEGVAWGCEWQWGYYKHPPLAAWLSNLAVVLQGSPGFTLYALAQICIIITFIAVWKLSKNMMNENYALISVISISTIYYYSFPTCTFNPNVISFPISALLILFIYKVSRKYSVFNWCVIGVLAGLSVLAKYVGAFIFLPALVYFIINRDIRKQILSVGFLLAFILYFFIITPHLIWLFNNDFEPVNYAFGKTDVFFTVKSIWDHIHWPLDYIVNIILPAIPLIIITVILCFKNGKDEKIERNFQNTTFVILVLLGSFVFTFFLTLLLGVHVNPYWTMTFFNFTMTALLYFFRPDINLNKFRSKFVIVFCFLTIIIPSIIIAFLTQFLPPVINGKTVHIQFPGKNIAILCNNLWHKHTSLPFKYVGGFGPDYKSFVNSYLKSRPSTYELFCSSKSPWTSKDDIQENGALFIWEHNEKNTDKIIDRIKDKFDARIKVLPVKEVPWLNGSIFEQYRNHPQIRKKILELSKYLPFLKEKIDPIKIKIVMVLPNKQKCKR